jgi:hypothetical protein
MPITIRGRETLSIPEGKHEAKISSLKVEKRGKEGYEYLDVHVELYKLAGKDGKKPDIKYGMPFDLSANTKLGKLLIAFGVTEDEIKSKEPLNLEDILKVGMKVQVLTKDVETPNGTFAEIVSLKPA